MFVDVVVVAVAVDACLSVRPQRTEHLILPHIVKRASPTASLLIRMVAKQLGDVSVRIKGREDIPRGSRTADKNTIIFSKKNIACQRKIVTFC